MHVSNREKSCAVIDDIRVRLQEFVKEYICAYPSVDRSLIVIALCEFAAATGVTIVGKDSFVQESYKALQLIEPRLELRVIQQNKASK